jgi:pSer/pThr/pTyr-binding forkhead associated (FHA) protein
MAGARRGPGDADVLEVGRPDRAARGVGELVVVNDAAERRYTIGKSIMTIGRSSRCDIQVLTQFVSREHARLVVDSAGVFVEDASSTNGVFVNAVRVERQLLAHGDLLTIGETQFRFLEAAIP